MKIGLFQMNGGTEADPSYQIGSPIFYKITIALNPKYYSGKEFIIKSEGNSPSNVYVKSATWNYKQVVNLELSHSQITGGCELRLEMSVSPEK